MDTLNIGTARPSAVVASLHRAQANAMVLYQNTKKYHWLSHGPLFRDLHLLFDEHATEVLGTVDDYAERALMVDGRPLADPADYLAHATVRPSSGQLTMRAMVEEAVANLDVVIDDLHGGAETATQAGDIGTADLYTRLVQVHQKQRWFLKEVLAHGDGLVAR